MGPFGKFYPSEAFFHSYDMVGEEKNIDDNDDDDDKAHFFLRASYSNTFVNKDLYICQFVFTLHLT